MYVNYAETKSCDLKYPNLGLNEFIWFFSRSISNYVWIIPILFVFWPKSIVWRKRRAEPKKIDTGSKDILDSYLNTEEKDDIYPIKDENPNDKKSHYKRSSYTNANFKNSYKAPFA